MQKKEQKSSGVALIRDDKGYTYQLQDCVCTMSRLADTNKLKKTPAYIPARQALNLIATEKKAIFYPLELREICSYVNDASSYPIKKEYSQRLNLISKQIVNLCNRILNEIKTNKASAMLTVFECAEQQYGFYLREQQQNEYLCQCS